MHRIATLLILSLCAFSCAEPRTTTVSDAGITDSALVDATVDATATSDAGPDDAGRDDAGPNDAGTDASMGCVEPTDCTEPNEVCDSETHACECAAGYVRFEGDCVSVSALAQQAYVKASNTNESDFFGESVTLSADGNTLAVAAELEDSNATGIDGDQADNSADSSGAVYVFSRASSEWVQQAYIKAWNTNRSDHFGNALELSADGATLAVGAPLEDSSARDSGAVYVFARTGSTWAQQAFVKASNADAGDRFGTELALSADGNTLAVGALEEDSNATGINGDQADNSSEGSGAVYVFTREGSSWVQEAYVKASNTGTNDEFSGSVALSTNGNTLAVGALQEGSSATGVDGDQADNSAVESGAVYVYSRTGSVWTQQAYLKASNTDVGDYFATTISISGDGNTLAVGAPKEDSGATGIDGDQDDDSAYNSGAVYIFARASSTWAQMSYLKASNTGTEDEFGFSVALSADGEALAVGAYRESSNATGINGNQGDNSANESGAVYLYSRAGSTWVQDEYVKASNTDAQDRFGIVALSADGRTLAVGAWAEDSSATGIDGDESSNSAPTSGAAYVFTRP